MKKRSKMLCVATALATAYVVYLICYFNGAMSSSDDVEAIAGAIATALVTPHMAVMGIGAVFGWLSVFLKAPWSALVAAILYAVGAVLFIAYIMFSLPIMIFGFIGYAKQKKILKTEKEVVAE